MPKVKMMNKKLLCRLCGEFGSLNEVICLKDFPKAAQFLPTKDEFGDDIPIEIQVFECMYCGLVQINNEPVSYFKDVITAASLSPSSQKDLIAELTKIITKYKLQRARTLEIGAGKGDFIALLTDLGLDAIGVEHNINNVNAALKKGANVHQGYLLDTYERTSRYNFVVCNNFLEHQPKTKYFLQKIYSLLEDKALLYISVPNVQRIIDTACFYEFVADHLVYFSKETLKKALEMSGFDILQLYFKNANNDIVVVARKRASLDLSKKTTKMNLIIDSISSQVDKLTQRGNKVSVWGAGHRALALMALSKLNKIDYVIDSADFKQGRHTPILRKKIVSPDYFFKTKECDFLIVMLPGSLSSQVKKYLKDKQFKGKTVYFNDEVISLES